jgi:hypothetical protein
MEVIAVVEKYTLTASPTPKMIVEITGNAHILRLMLIIYSYQTIFRSQQEGPSPSRWALLKLGLPFKAG